MELLMPTEQVPIDKVVLWYTFSCLCYAVWITLSHLSLSHTNTKHIHTFPAAGMMGGAMGQYRMPDLPRTCIIHWWINTRIWQRCCGACTRPNHHLEETYQQQARRKVGSGAAPGGHTSQTTSEVCEDFSTSCAHCTKVWIYALYFVCVWRYRLHYQTMLWD